MLAETNNRKVSSFPEYDLGLGFLYTHRILPAELDKPNRWVNFHPGPLPDMRGRNLAYHAILEGRPTFGASIHYMDREFDTGELIECVRFSIEPHHTAGDLVRISHEILVQLFKKHVPALLAGKVPSAPQSGGRYYRKSVINDEVQLTPDQSRYIRAVTVAPRHVARTSIGGKVFRIVPE